MDLSHNFCVDYIRKPMILHVFAKKAKIREIAKFNLAKINPI